MIRRNSASAHERAWVLISQIEHAHLAADLAAHWIDADRVLELPAVQWAVRHHDDGWALWEMDPQIDPAQGRPLAFTEMPAAAAQAIWSRSIETAAEESPLAAWLVASHFSALLRTSSDVELPQSRRWLARYDALCDTWLRTWQASAAAATPAVAATALHWLQMFDGLSLWFCCAERSEVTEVTTPEGTVTFRPLTSDRMAVSPWPFRTAELKLSVTGRMAPAAHYSDSHALAAAGKMQRLEWTLLPR